MIRTLIVDGQNNHEWKAVEPILKSNLQHTGRFAVDVTTTPPSSEAAEAEKQFQPEFDECEIVLLNYFGRDGPSATSLSNEGVRAGRQRCSVSVFATLVPIITVISDSGMKYLSSDLYPA